MGAELIFSGNQFETLKALLNPSAGGPAVDAFSRLRVSEPLSLFESEAQYNANPLRIESGSSGTDGVAPAWSSSTRMNTLKVNNGASGGTSFMQSFQYIPYQPGKSQLIFITGVLNAGVAGAVKRFGYGDANNGIFYEQNGTSGLQFNRRTSTSGSVVNNTVTQANWNLDKFDGTGPSGITLDPTKCFILIIDLQFLSMGRVRCGFDINGNFYYAHQFLNANVLTVPYMQSATLPIMIEVVAAAGLGSAASAQFKCAAVISEGGLEFGLGRDFAAEGTVTAGSGTRTHILSVRPLTTFNGLTNRGLFILNNIDILAGTNALLWELCVGVTFTGGGSPTFAAVNSTYSFMEAGTGGTFSALTNGIVIAKGYVPAGAKANASSESISLVTSYPITLDRSGAVRPLGTMSLLVTGIGGTSDARASLNWLEVR